MSKNAELWLYRVGVVYFAVSALGYAAEADFRFWRTTLAVCALIYFAMQLGRLRA